ncbi:helix-turn-helix transcriptional regulator [Nocardioides sp. MJB4]|uniref:Helix-turn-helix transcriptional regulator n=2 Tax=Nocardioides donggukensis TaxID=2774019 RepID=A0A927PYT6_9ACTN|nr:helix-turn-helix transcriptional regulator [Nocardioides donggukensis]
MAAACPTRQLVTRIGDRWSLLVITALTGRTLRFAELRHTLEGVSQKMLTQTLRQLERDGIVHRQAYAEVPPRVEYNLTPLGDTLTDLVAAIRDWAYTNINDIESYRHTYDQRHNSPG